MSGRFSTGKVTICLAHVLVAWYNFSIYTTTGIFVLSNIILNLEPIEVIKLLMHAFISAP